MNLPLKALSIMQPWAWLIVNGHKNIENRDWRTTYRGPVAIHAGKKMDESAYTSLIRSYHPVTSEPYEVAAPATHYYHQGGIVGVAEIVDCVEQSSSSWFVGRYGFVIRNARPVPLIPVKGALGFFNWQDRRI